jgi:hypothetical protein
VPRPPWTQMPTCGAAVADQTFFSSCTRCSSHATASAPGRAPRPAGERARSAVVCGWSGSELEDGRRGGVRAARRRAGGVREKRGNSRVKENKNCRTHGLEGDLEALQEWRLRREIWRGLQNGGLFGGPTGVDFFYKTSRPIWRPLLELFLWVS